MKNYDATNRMTMNQLARELNISRTTLYNIMHQKGSFSIETQEKVFKALKDYNFTVNRNARNLAKNQKYQIAFVGFYSTRFAYFFEEIDTGIERVAREYADDGLQVLRAYSDREDPQRQIEDLKELEEQGIENFVIFCYHYQYIYPYIQEMIERGRNIILFSRKIPKLSPLCNVGSDHYLSGRLMGELMEKLSPEGSRVQLLISEHNHHDKLVVGERLDGFRYALKNLQKNFTILEEAWTSPVPVKEEKEIRKVLAERKPDVIIDFVCNLGCVSKYLKETKREKTIVLGFDVYPEIVPYIKDSTIDAVIFQDLPAQSYKAIQLLFEYVCYGKKPENENYFSPLNVVFASNCEYFEKL